MNGDNEEERRPPSFLSVLGSVLASMFGVQSSRKHEMDAAYGKPVQYVLVGLLVTAIFVLAIWGVVTLVVGLAR